MGGGMGKISDESEFEQNVGARLEEIGPNYDKNVNIAFVGKVSTGKSSLLNAILLCDRQNCIAEVGARSGVQTKVTPYRLDDKVLIVDCPGLDDMRRENSDQTKNFINSIDLGVFVVTGSADANQRKNFDDLKKHCKSIIVVLNKIDIWDKLNPAAYSNVQKQWMEALGVDKIYGTCADGYDPETRPDVPMDIRGVDEVRDHIFKFLSEQGTDVLLARHLRTKDYYARKIIQSAIVAVSGAAFVPGSAAFILATQAAAISSLNYIYTGDFLSKSSALMLLPGLINRSIGENLLLFAKSFLPPTLIIDATAAAIAATLTLTILLAVKWMLENNHSLEEKDLLVQAFERYRKELKQEDLTKQLSDE
jgi:small GTP-binding protein